jgi:hypothetical protein
MITDKNMKITKNKTKMRQIVVIIILAVSFLTSTESYAQNYSFKWTNISPAFPNGTSSLVSYIDFGSTAIWGYVQISLTGDYQSQNTTGKYSKLYNVGKALTGVFYSNSSEVSTAFGPVADQWKLGEFETDASGHLKVPIYHLVGTGNTVVVNIEGVSSGVINTALIQITPPQVLTNNSTRDYRFTNESVAIGTNKIEPGTKLTVGGKMAAREIKVSTDAGADFVFNNDYELPSLKEVEKYISENKHLPEVPSAPEMITNGVELGKMNILLLQKIEELTLYMIKKDKEIEALRNEIKEIKINYLKK